MIKIEEIDRFKARHPTRKRRLGNLALREHVSVHPSSFHSPRDFMLPVSLILSTVFEMSVSCL